MSFTPLWSLYDIIYSCMIRDKALQSALQATVNYASTPEVLKFIQFFCTEDPPTTVRTFQSTSIPFSRKMARASSAMPSYPSVARARIVGPAPDKQMPRRPGWLAGVILDVTSGKPGIYVPRILVFLIKVKGLLKWRGLTDQCFTVWLVDLIFHCLVYQIRIRWFLSKCGC